MSFLRKIAEKLGGASSPRTASDDLLDEFVREHPITEKWVWHHSQDWTDTPTGAKILTAVLEVQAETVGAIVNRLNILAKKIKQFQDNAPAGVGLHNLHLEKGWNDLLIPRLALQALLEALLARKLPLGTQLVMDLTDMCLSARYISSTYCPINKVAMAAENLAESSPLQPPLVEKLQALLKRFNEQNSEKDLRKARQRIENALGQAPKFPIQAGEVWADAAIADIKALPSSKQTAWTELLSLCQTTSGAQPSAKWLKQVETLLANLLPRDDFKQTVLKWFPLVDKPRLDEPRHRWGGIMNPLTISDLHADILRGLVWTCALFEDKEIARAVGSLAVSAYRKIPGTGPRLVRVGNACVYTLGAMVGMDGVGQLSILRARVKFGTAQKMIEKALNVTAQRLGLPKDDLEEMAVPTYGLEEVGKSIWTFDDFTAELVVPDSKTTEIIWKNSAGKIQKSVPAKVKTDFAVDLKELKAAEKDIQKMLPAQVERVDQLFLQQKEWPLALWRERYLDHPLVGVIARRLIWRFRHGAETHDGLWQDGAIADRQGRVLDLPADTRVSLWHPLVSRPEEIQAWRVWLEEKQIRQPFKQAHREIYVLTPAEENTRTYSNRFAAHVLKQHQFNALAQWRGWKNQLRLMVDASYPPAHVLLPKWNLRAEFWIEGAGSEYGQDTNDTGTYLYLTTDQVRFYAINAAQRHAHAYGGGFAPDRTDAEPLPLAEIPPLVFSEIMRDVDLFVGVASVANDPNWNDGGPQGRHVQYWQSQSFGELGASAQMRKEILQRLVPRLKISSQCSFEGNFLLVKGQLHTYKIHLGSSNILMSPNDRYLCIVAKSSVIAPTTEKVFLPFEGDSTMAVILSKAFMLSADGKIKDETIIRQIRA